MRHLNWKAFKLSEVSLGFCTPTLNVKWQEGEEVESWGALIYTLEWLLVSRSKKVPKLKDFSPSQDLGSRVKEQCEGKGGADKVDNFHSKMNNPLFHITSFDKCYTFIHATVSY